MLSKISFVDFYRQATSTIEKFFKRFQADSCHLSCSTMKKALSAWQKFARNSLNGVGKNWMNKTQSFARRGGEREEYIQCTQTPNSLTMEFRSDETVRQRFPWFPSRFRFAIEQIPVQGFLPLVDTENISSSAQAFQLCVGLWWNSLQPGERSEKSYRADYDSEKIV